MLTEADLVRVGRRFVAGEVDRATLYRTVLAAADEIDGTGWWTDVELAIYDDASDDELLQLFDRSSGLTPA
jgi:hypothetical protein